MAAGRRLEIARGDQGSLDARIHGVGAPVFSPDGSRVAYAAHRGKDDEVVMLDGQPGPQFASIGDGPVFSGDGLLVAYVASNVGDTFLVIDGKRVASSVAFERVGDKLYMGGGAFSQTKFAPDNKRVSYVRLTNVDRPTRLKPSLCVTWQGRTYLVSTPTVSRHQATAP